MVGPAEEAAVARGNWWATETVRGELDLALGHLNHAAARDLGAVYRCRCLYDGLNVLWSAHQRARRRLEEGDNAALSALLLEGLPSSRRALLVRHPAIEAFATFAPPVLDHSILRRSPEYAHGSPIPARLERDAADKHGQFTRAFSRWTESSSQEAERALLKKFAQLLYVVRSNIAHGEKSFVERDRAVCDIAARAIDAALDALFDYPDHRLATYGTLAPGQQNHSLIAAASGEWSEGVVHGVINRISGLLAFEWRPDGQAIPVHMVSSPRLEKLLPDLDVFEGRRYRRIRVPVDQPGQGVAIANVYEWAGISQD